MLADNTTACQKLAAIPTTAAAYDLPACPCLYWGLDAPLVPSNRVLVCRQTTIASISRFPGSNFCSAFDF
jgi:hypothetical protein